MNLNSKLKHKPVLLQEVLAGLNPQTGETYLDATAGGGGHARAIAQFITDQNLTLIDIDPQTIDSLRLEFKQAQIYNSNFARQGEVFLRQNLTFDMILADLGLSSMQLDQSDRGFSFRHNAPLDMRFNNQQGLSLRQKLKDVDETTLSRILKEYAQEKHASAIARKIIMEQPQTTFDLAQLVKSVKIRRRHLSKTRFRIHPATQIFMALRIWLNDELSNLENFLTIAPKLLKPGGRLAIISFHSLEDRLVKLAFRDLADGLYDTSFLLKDKKPIIPNSKTIALNPRCRSAKLRFLHHI
ncbi:MAG: 16S rRNA (cytosine(1402)-N(4))-methyltransferase RsmH [Candidatus Saccharibacteria bacterium]|nr:16S rRNA (cytosine(1402)-N(4))-methyltransferase RsmH [Candidatus Saccharibacteria bacterium]